MNEMNNHTITT